jgi:hypothetical protein
MHIRTINNIPDMRHSILLVLMGLVCVTGKGQTINPYESFGYQPKHEYVMTQPSLTIDNTDRSRSIVSKIIVDAANKVAYLYGKDSTLISEVRLKENEIMRFLSVDPLTKKYPGLTPYQFASNQPIWAIDLDGEEAFIVHGTTQGQSGVNFSQAAIDQFKRLTGNSQVDDKFRWYAPALNDMPMRKTAAEDLVKYIVETRANLIANKTITEDEPVSLIGYSHGGNVDIQAADLLYKQYNVKVNLINVSTPAYNSWFGVDKDNILFGNAEDPQGNQGINSLIHIIHQNDRVWQLAKADMYYSDADGKTRDFTIVQNSPELNGPINSHTNLPSSPVLGLALSLLSPLRPAPVPTGLNNAINGAAQSNAGEQQAAQQAAGTIWQNIPVH